MKINILLIIVIILLICFGIAGFKEGLVSGITSIVSYTIGIIVLSIMIKAIGNIAQKSWLNVIVALILLMIIRIIHKVLKLVLDSAKLVSKLPIINWVDKFAGTFIGIIRGLLVIWMLLLLLRFTDMSNINEFVVQQVNDNSLLQIIYHSNIIVKIVDVLI